ncbi:MAG: DUF2809 domain-containing protein [Nostoc sp.]|uniref:ribosomal maturation YjgA family protein n=1 Tax=Nostoc sp. TaxID=1180 RepID=UPI002FFA0638
MLCPYTKRYHFVPHLNGNRYTLRNILVFVCILVFQKSNGDSQNSHIGFVITCILEFLQLLHPPLLNEIRATLVGKLLLGTTFVWWDFPHYGLGCVLGCLWLRQLQKIGYAKKSQG